MKPSINDTTGQTPSQHAKFIGVTLTCFGLLSLGANTARADRGRGSIRDAARPDVRVEPARDRPEDRHDAPVVVARDRPDERRDGPVAPQRVETAVHHDWDDNDEDPRHWGGFAQGVAARVIRGQRVHDLPPAHVDVVYNNQHYFYDPTGVYYQQQSDGQYLVIQPPVGVIVAALPAGVTPILVGPTTYYYLDGVFYVPQANAFAVVTPPAGIVVPSLPAGANQLISNGTVLYQFNGVDYQPSLQDGVTVYTASPA